MRKLEVLTLELLNESQSYLDCFRCCNRLTVINTISNRELLNLELFETYFNLFFDGRMTVSLYLYN